MALDKPDFTTDTATEYKTAIDVGFQGVERTAWSFAPHPAATPDMTVRLNPGAIWDGSTDTLTEKAAQTTSTFTAPVTNPRIDRIVVDETTGDYSIVAGSEAASPTAPAIPTGKFPVCQIEFATTTTSIGYVATATVAAIVDERVPFIVAGGAGGKLAQMVYVTDGAAATGTTLIPYDDTIPQNTEGDEYMTLAITPTSATNILIIDVRAFVGSSGSTNRMTTAIFQDSTVGALAAGAIIADNTATAHRIGVRHVMIAGTTSSTTFKVRIGGAGAGTTTFNGSGGTRDLGGVLGSGIVITEIEP